MAERDPHHQLPLRGILTWTWAQKITIKNRLEKLEDKGMPLVSLKNGSENPVPSDELDKKEPEFQLAIGT